MYGKNQLIGAVAVIGGFVLWIVAIAFWWKLALAIAGTVFIVLGFGLFRIQTPR